MRFPQKHYHKLSRCLALYLYIITLLSSCGHFNSCIFFISSLTFCGIVMKQYVIFNISEKSQTTIKYFLKMLSSMTETVIFMLLGTSTIKDDHVWDVAFIVLTIVSCLVYRALGRFYSSNILPGDLMLAVSSISACIHISTFTPMTLLYSPCNTQSVTLFYYHDS